MGKTLDCYMFAKTLETIIPTQYEENVVGNTHTCQKTVAAKSFENDDGIPKESVARLLSVGVGMIIGPSATGRACPSSVPPYSGPNVLLNSFHRRRVQGTVHFMHSISTLCKSRASKLRCDTTCCKGASFMPMP